ncbi:hypothetical protein F2P81_021580 [Scophthalmus maximus]|uniref:Uncharacterized protein n=1 Tax=Scophthalmus maximus TaxID=52904 RepID=A0A6A4RXS3_SCOMX|nr:hypothetical protein F2P81_021580 [Scophthalmus maximus]
MTRAKEMSLTQRQSDKESSTADACCAPVLNECKFEFRCCMKCTSLLTNDCLGPQFKSKTDDGPTDDCERTGHAVIKAAAAADRRHPSTAAQYKQCRIEYCTRVVIQREIFIRFLRVKHFMGRDNLLVPYYKGLYKDFSSRVEDRGVANVQVKLDNKTRFWVNNQQNTYKLVCSRPSFICDSTRTPTEVMVTRLKLVFGDLDLDWDLNTGDSRLDSDWRVGDSTTTLAPPATSVAGVEIF